MALKGRANVRLATFLREQAVDLEDIYRGNGRSGWTNLKRDAGLLTTPTGPETMISAAASETSCISMTQLASTCYSKWVSQTHFVFLKTTLSRDCYRCWRIR